MSRNRKKGYSRRGIIKSKSEIDRLFRETFANNYQGTFAEDLNSRAISCYPNKRYLFEFSATEKAANARRFMHGGVHGYFIELAASYCSYFQLMIEGEDYEGISCVNNHYALHKRTELGENLKVEVTPKKLGRNMHFWEVHIIDEKEDLISSGDVTLYRFSQKKELPHFRDSIQLWWRNAKDDLLRVRTKLPRHPTGE